MASPSAAVTIQPVITSDHLRLFKDITRSYLNWLDEDLDYQGVEDELNALPGYFDEKLGGCMLLAFEPTHTDGNDSDNQTCIGAVAVRCLAGLYDGDHLFGHPIRQVCELKRLFVLPKHQNRGAGKALTEEAMKKAREGGYHVMVLDTLDRLVAANKLYASLGFEQCDAYNHCPLEKPMYFRKNLL
jgi:GNAT superfamily N-acetyltransferase